jgi:hypothetical protein
MSVKDMKNNVVVSNAFDIQAIATDTTTSGDIIDTQGFDSVTFVVQSGAYTDGTYTVNIQVGDDSGLSDAADATAVELIGTEPALSAANGTGRVGTLTNKRYARMQIVSTSTTTGATIGGTVILGHPAIAATA